MPACDPNAETPRQPKLLERMRIHLRTRHYSIRTEEAYIDWVWRFILLARQIAKAPHKKTARRRFFLSSAKRRSESLIQP